MSDDHAATTTRAPVRIAHLGLGAFHRAHQAWYTQVANGASDEQWGIEAFSGRRTELVDALREQDFRYTLIVRDSDVESATRIDSIVAAAYGDDGARWREVIADPAVALLTMTITEAGYALDVAVECDKNALVADDGAAMLTAPGRIVDGLRARSRAHAGPFAIVSCDNLPRNGAVTHDVVVSLAAQVDRGLAEWIERNVSFVSSVVDRITPGATLDDSSTALALTGHSDALPVVTEPFSEWILSGEFPAGRPHWESGGARFVDNIEAFENRKLWLLNGAHSLLAYVGTLRGHDTVDEAMNDEWCRERLEQLWAEARDVIDLNESELDAAVEALRARFANSSIRHLLLQIAADGSEKLPSRIVEVQRRRLAAGLTIGAAGALALAAWLTHLRDHPEWVSDARASGLHDQLTHSDGDAQVELILDLIAPDKSHELSRAVSEALAELEPYRKDHS